MRAGAAGAPTYLQAMSENTNLFEYLVTELGGIEAPEGIKVGDTTVRLKWDDDGQTVEIEAVLIVPQGTGLGARLVEALRKYCDEGGKELRIVDATNPNFWRRFPWLADGELEMDHASEHSGEAQIEFWYTPEGLLV